MKEMLELDLATFCFSSCLVQPTTSKVEHNKSKYNVLFIMKNPPKYILKANLIIFINIYSINIMITYTKSKEYM